MKDSDTARVFFALWPDVTIQKELHALAKEYQASCDARVMKTDTLHMTLLFIGEIGRAHLPQLMQIAGKVSVPPFDIALTKLSFWPHNRIAYATSPEKIENLDQLAAMLRHELKVDGFQFKNHKFVPHVTLMRNVKNIPEPQEIKPIMWRVDSFALVESVTTDKGASYKILQKWPLSL